MKYKLIIPIVTIIVAAIALVAYMQILAPKSMDQKIEMTEENASTGALTEEMNNETGPNDAEGMMVGTLEDIFQLGNDVFCTYSDGKEAEPAYTSGNLYIANGGERMRGMFTMTEEDLTKTTMNLIRNETGNYMWEEGRNDGYLTKLDPEKDSFLQDLLPEADISAAEADAPADAMMEKTDPSASMSFECKAWEVDDKMFELPSGVEFIDLTQQMMELENSLKDGGCSTCNQLPDGDAKEQCLTLMGC